MVLDISQIDNYIKKILKDSRIPGLALGIVNKNKVMYAKGFGYRDLENKLPVTEKTLFAIGSITKSFTALAIAMLAVEDIINLDTPIKHYLPEFMFATEEGTFNITMRDLLAHRTGLPRHDFVLYSDKCTYEQLIKRLLYLKPIHGLREQFEYNNIMYVIAGQLAAKLNRSSWSKLISDRILTELDMTDTCFLVNEIKNYHNIALPYQFVENNVSEISFKDLDYLAPAGAMNSTLEDMMKYMRFHLKAVRNSATKINEIYQPQMSMPLPFSGIPRVMPLLKEFEKTNYGLGLISTHYKNHLLIHHGGEVPGFTSMMCLLPDKDIGIIVLTNMTPTLAPITIALDIVDILLNLANSNWYNYFKSFDKSLSSAIDKANSRKSSNKIDLQDYLGTYKHPGYGIVKVEQNDNKLNIWFNKINACFQHEQNETFISVTGPLKNLRINFSRNMNGIVMILNSYLQADFKPISFLRFVDKNLLSHNMVGSYYLENQNYHINVTVIHNVLLIEIPGKTRAKMVPVTECYYLIPKFPDHAIRFITGSSDLIFYIGNQAILLTKHAIHE